jgi:hypothetical protein
MEVEHGMQNVENELATMNVYMYITYESEMHKHPIGFILFFADISTHDCKMVCKWVRIYPHHFYIDVKSQPPDG